MNCVKRVWNENIGKLSRIKRVWNGHWGDGGMGICRGIYRAPFDALSYPPTVPTVIPAVGPFKPPRHNTPCDNPIIYLSRNEWDIDK